MNTSKKPILEIEPYADEVDYVDFCIALGTLIKQRFKTGCDGYGQYIQHKAV